MSDDMATPEFNQQAMAPNSKPGTDAARDWRLVKVMTVLSLFFGIFAALLGYVLLNVKSNADEGAQAQMVELLNFQITVAGLFFISMILNVTVILAFIGLILFFALVIGNLVLLIKSLGPIGRSTPYKFPMTVRLIS